MKEMKARDIKVVADISTESGQVDFAADVVKLKARQRRRDLRLHQRGGERPLPARSRASRASRPLIGETTLLGQKVIELAGDAANGVTRPCRPLRRRAGPGYKEFDEKFKERFNYVPDHNGIKGYTAVYVIQGGDGEDRQVRQQGLRRDAARHDDRPRTSPAS